jgi:hypothetical protein
MVEIKLSELRGNTYMDRGIFMGFSLLGMAVALAAFFPLGARRRAAVSRAVWWSCLCFGVIISGYGLSHSTSPSYAPRITAVGKAYNHVEVRQGRDTHYGIDFVPTDSGLPVHLETSIILSGWAVPEIFSGRIYRVVYLQDKTRALKDEAVDITILSGRNAGFHSSVDARPLGTWLAIPIGAALGVFGGFGLRYRKDDELSASLGNTPEPA